MIFIQCNAVSGSATLTVSGGRGASAAGDWAANDLVKTIWMYMPR